MKCYSTPYEGDKDFIFISYSHKDAARVYPIVERLTLEGFRVWYDRGIHPGEDWPEVIATHLEKAGAVVAAISKSSMNSHNCKNEINFAVGNNKSLVTIVIEDVKMTAGVKLQLSSSHYIRMKEYRNPEDFYSALLGSSVLEKCRDGNKSAGEAELALWRQHAEEYRQLESKSSPKPAVLTEIFNGAEPSATNRPRPPKHDPSPVQEVSGKDQKDPTDEGTTYVNEDDSGGTVYIHKRPEDTTQKRGDDADEGTVREEKRDPALLIRIQTGEVFYMLEDQTVIGRKNQKQPVQIALAGNEGISRKHAQIERRIGGYSLIDLHSKNGTEMNGQPVSTDEPVPMGKTAVIVMGDEEFLFVSDSAFKPVRRDESIGLLRSVRTGEIRVLEGRKFPLDRGHMWEDNVLGSLHISRRSQTEILHKDGAFTVSDLNSPNGTFLNGRKLSGAEEKMNNGDELSVVDERFVFYEIPLNNR